MNEVNFIQKFEWNTSWNQTDNHDYDDNDNRMHENLNIIFLKQILTQHVENEVICDKKDIDTY